MSAARIASSFDGKTRGTACALVSYSGGLSVGAGRHWQMPRPEPIGGHPASGLQPVSLDESKVPTPTLRPSPFAEKMPISPSEGVGGHRSSSDEDDEIESIAGGDKWRKRSRIAAIVNSTRSADARKTCWDDLTQLRWWKAFRKRGYIFKQSSWAIGAWDTLLMVFIIFTAVYGPLVFVFHEAAWRIPGTSFTNDSLSNVRSLYSCSQAVSAAPAEHVYQPCRAADPNLTYVRTSVAQVLDFVFLTDVLVKARTSYEDHGCVAPCPKHGGSAAISGDQRQE